jgi:cell division protein ZapA
MDREAAMTEVTVEVAGRAYRLGCGEGEEAHLTGLAAMIDAEARALVRQFGQMPEGRLLLMTALMVSDRLAEAEARSRDAEARLAEAKKLADERAQPADMFGPEREESLTRRINLLAAKIEGVAGGGQN